MSLRVDDAASTERSGDSAPFGRLLPWLLTIGGLIAFVASFVLTVERFELAANASYTPSCSLDAVLDCGTVMTTTQAALFGFPNPLLGIAGFAVVVATGAGLLAGARFARWYWLGLQIGLTAATVFVHWLMSQSIFVIGALCPYCMVVWAMTIPIFWYVTLRNLNHGVFSRPLAAEVVTAKGNHLLPLVIWYVAVAALVIFTFYQDWIGL